jgi:cyanophycinase-like exopeptidase
MIKAEVVKACTINSAPKKPGDSVEVDENTFNNLVRKGVLKAAGAKAVKIVDAPALAKIAETPLRTADATTKPRRHARHS